MKKRLLVIFGAVVAVLFFGMVFAATVSRRVSWSPEELKPNSIVPGGSASYTVVLKHTGLLPIGATNQLRVVAEGDMASLVTITQPAFPSVFKRGNEVNVAVRVKAPLGSAYVRKSGQLVVQRVLPNNKVKEVWRTEELSVEFVFSNISLPPYPNTEVNNATLEGVDENNNMVRDDLEHEIVSRFPDSEKKRAVLMEEARRNQIFLLDTYPSGEEGKLKAWGNHVGAVKANYCATFLFGVVDGSYEALEEIGELQKELDQHFQNTPERARAFNDALGHIGGKSSGRVPANDQEFRQTCLDIDINPDTFTN